MNMMPSAVRANHGGLSALFAGASLEITAKDCPALADAAALLPAGTPVSITFLPGEDCAARVAAAAEVARAGLLPVPHIAARRLTSARALEEFLDRLAGAIALDQVFVIAGDAVTPLGPYEDALEVIRSGLLERYGVKHVGIGGYPEGHPGIATPKLWQALADKHAAIAEQGMACSIMTQFGFDAEPILGWLNELRGRGIDSLVRIGVAGPASVKSLLRFAARCGVGASTRVLAKYGISITRLLGTAGPDPVIAALAAEIDPGRHGDACLHFYPFGGLVTTARWMEDYRRDNFV